MDVSYDDIPFQAEVPVRVFSSKCNQKKSVIFFDFCGKPAKIFIPSQTQVNKNTTFESFRSSLHSLARNLESKNDYYTAPRYTSLAMQIESILKDFKFDWMPPPSHVADEFGYYPLEWFFCVKRLQFHLVQNDDGRTCVIQQVTVPGIPPCALPQTPRHLPAILSTSLRVAPVRCGKNRVSGRMTVDAGSHIGQIGPGTYTFVSVREIGGCVQSENGHRAFSFQLRKLELIGNFCLGLTFEDRATICVPNILAYIHRDLGTHAVTSLPVGAVFEELPNLLPLQSLAPPADIMRRWVLKICLTVEWLIEKGIGWGGSIEYSEDLKGQALLDATVVDALGRPWLIEGFIDTRRKKVLSDRASVQMVRAQFGLLGVEHID